MEFVLLASAHFLALLSPGPDFFLIVQASLRLPLRCGLAICLGIAAANAVYLLFAVLGLETVRETQWLIILLKYSGAAYLVFLGSMLLRSPRQALNHKEPDSFLHTHSLGKQLAVGFTSGILNPKNAIFYLSLFTVIVSHETVFTVRCLYALWMTSVVLVWDVLLVLIIGNDRLKNALGQGVFFIEKISGFMLTLFGILLPFS